MGQGFVTMFLKVGHERRPSSANVCGVVWALLALLVDIPSGVFQMLRAEPSDPLDTGVVGVTQCRLNALMGDDILTNGRSLLERFDKCPVGRRHVVAHFYEIQP